VDRKTALPVFLGVSERSWMPAVPAELKSSEPCRLKGKDVLLGLSSCFLILTFPAKVTEVFSIPSRVLTV
jgi:hypothetical protein